MTELKIENCTDAVVKYVKSGLKKELKKLKRVIDAKKSELSELEDLINENADNDGCLYEYGDLTAKYQEIEESLNRPEVNYSQIEIALNDFTDGKTVTFPVQVI